MPNMFPNPNREGDGGAATVEEGASTGACCDGVDARAVLDDAEEEEEEEDCGGAVIGDAVRCVEAGGRESSCIAEAAEAGRA